MPLDSRFPCSKLDLVEDFPLWRRSSRLWVAASAWNSSASVNIFASSESSDITRFQELTRGERGEGCVREGPRELALESLGLVGLADVGGEVVRGVDNGGADVEWDSGIGRGPGLLRSGLEPLPPGRSWGGRGDIGTFHKVASSGSSSSESWYSSSNSSIVFLGRCCDIERVKDRDELSRGLGGSGVLLAGDNGIGCVPGEGDLERCREEGRSWSEGVEGLEITLRDPLLDRGRLRDCIASKAPRTCPWSLGLSFLLVEAVKSLVVVVMGVVRGPIPEDTRRFGRKANLSWAK